MNKKPSFEKGKIEFIPEETQKERKAALRGTKDAGGASVFVILSAVLFLLFFYSLLGVISYDSFQYSIAYVSGLIVQNIQNFVDWLLGNGVYGNIAMRTVQYLTIVVVGAGLSCAGAMYKSIFRNAIAAPTTMGVQEGGILGNLIYIGIFGSAVAVNTTALGNESLFGKLSEHTFFANYGQSLFLFAGCFIGVGLVMLIATTAGRRSLSASALILSGTIVNGSIAGITGAVQYYVSMNAGDDDLVRLMLYMTMGTFEFSYRVSELILLCATQLPCILIMFLLANKMNIYSLGEETARGMGMKVRRFKIIVIVLGAFMTAVTMVCCGHIAFMGFIVPQITIKLTGPNFRKLLPASALMGGIVMLAVYDIATFVNMRDGISMLTSYVGGAMLIYMLMTKRSRHLG